MKGLSRTDLPVSEKVYLAASAITMGKSYGEVRGLAERFDLTAPTLYGLKGEVAELLREQFEPLGSDKGVRYIRLDREQLERAAVALRTVGTNSVPVIEELLPLLYPGLKVSYGRLHGIVSEAECKAERFNEGVALSKIVAAALDEMFSQGQPILSALDLDSGFVAILKAAKGRSGPVWAEALRAAKAQRFAPAQVVKDAGKGMDAGLDIELPDAERRDDSFHAAFELGKALHRLERRAYEAIEREEKARGQFEQLRCGDGVDLRGAAQRLRRAREQCNEAMELFDSFETQARLALEALEAVDVRRLSMRGASRMRQELLSCAARMLALPDRGARKVGRYLTNRAPGLVRYCYELHRGLLELGSAWGAQAGLWAAVLWQAAELLYHGRQRWARAAQTAALCAAWTELRRLLSTERATELLEAVERLFASRHRASSALEGFHASLRPHLYVHKGVSQGFLELYRAYYNLRTTRSGPHKGTSAYERLTGEKVIDWLTMLGYPPSVQPIRN